ncbi:metallophosphoesterase [Streptomyces tendae]|uniref:metallophosphoesterase n=1 Tax=Streptomyces tendae TaxID=1932 RepID=UPI003717DF93
MGLLILALLTAVHWYVWRRLVRDVTAPHGPARRAGTVAVIVLPLLSVGAFGATQAGAPFLLQRVLAWPGYLWVALLLYVTLALLVGEAVRPLLLRAGWERRERARPVVEPAADTTATLPGAAGKPVKDPTDEPAREPAPGPPAVDPSRRLFVSRVVGGAAAAAAVGVVGHGTWSVLGGPTVKRVTVPLTKLPRSAHGYRIAVVSDIHLGPILGRAHTQRIVDTVNATQPDLVTVVGDLVDGSVADLGNAADPLARLRSQDGSYFVTGNHEYYSGVEAWVERVHDMGVRPLRNAGLAVGGFHLAGVNDISGEDHDDAPDYGRALGSRDPSLASVLLAHQPVMIHEAVEHGVDLQLSGHTHGGQLWPATLVAGLSNPTVAGLERYGHTQLYVSRGAGAWGPPVRVGAPADITVVELASRQA